MTIMGELDRLSKGTRFVVELKAEYGTIAATIFGQDEELTHTCGLYS